MSTWAFLGENEDRTFQKDSPAKPSISTQHLSSICPEPIYLEFPTWLPLRFTEIKDELIFNASAIATTLSLLMSYV
jgi:hypothetical protein